MRNVLILFLRGGNASTAILPIEIFGFAGVLWNLLNDEPAAPRFKVITASVDGNPVRTDRTLSMTPECAFADAPQPDLVFVPAGGLEMDALIRQGYDIDAVIERNVEAVDWLRRWANGGARIGAVCSGVALLAESGLLDGRPATAHWGLIHQYRVRFPAVDWRPEYLVTDGGDVYCGGGVNAAADIALYLVEKFCGRETAVQCARALLIEMPRQWQTAFTQLCIRTAHNDACIQHAEEWLHQNHAQKDISLELLAAEMGMSARNFARRFKAATGKSPLNYLHALRIAAAKELLETENSGIQQIASRVGYTDVLFFRTLFKRHAGLSPNDYRKRFGMRRQAAEPAASA